MGNETRLRRTSPYRLRFYVKRNRLMIRASQPLDLFAVCYLVLVFLLA